MGLGDREQDLRQGTVETDALVQEFERCCRACDQNFENEEIGEILKITEPLNPRRRLLNIIREHMSTDQQIKEIVNFANVQLMRHDSAIVTSEQIRSATERACIAFSAMEGLEDIPEKIKQQVVEELECRWHTANEESSIVHDDQHRPWLPNAKQVRPMPYWDRYREYLGDTKGLPKNVVAAIDDATDKILDHTSDPESELNFDKRGMVVGHVQSGKTANYTGLICKG